MAEIALKQKVQKTPASVPTVMHLNRIQHPSPFPYAMGRTVREFIAKAVEIATTTSAISRAMPGQLIHFSGNILSFDCYHSRTINVDLPLAKRLWPVIGLAPFLCIFASARLKDR